MRLVVVPGKVYVIPPGQLLSIKNGRLQLTKMEGPCQPPIAVDFFFRSLAEDQKQCAVGVILSGTGSDGTLGVKAIKQAGGLVLAQDTETAEHTGMPEHAIGSGVVDQVLAPEAIPAALVRFASHDYICGEDISRLGGSPGSTADKTTTDETGASAKTASDADTDDDNQAEDQSHQGIDAIIDLLRTSGSRDFRNYKLATLLRRTRRRMCLHHIDTIENYLDFLKANPAEVQQLAGDLLISVTDFFRDPEAWQELADTTIPAIVRSRSNDDAVRVWVAGCATGEEAYTVAMLMLEEIGKQKRACKLQVFASEIDKNALDEARAGQYPVTRVANESVSVEDTLRSSLAKVTEFNGWFVGHVWRLAEGDPDDEPRMESSGIWHIDDSSDTSDGDNMREFQRVTGETRISRGEGLIGRVMQSAQPEWIDDIRGEPDSRFHRIGGVGMRAAIAFPILILGEVVGVMEFFADNSIDPQAQFLAIIPDIGIQLGHTINRKRLQSAVARIADAQQRRIGRELHDGIAQQLTGGAMIAQSLWRALPETMPGEIESADQLIEILNQTHNDVRDLSSGLMPDPVPAADLIPVLRGLSAETSERFNIRCHCDANLDETQLQNDGTVNLICQIAREAVHNAVKHAESEKIEIRVRLDDHFRLTVQDDGKGFDTQRRKTNTNGLRIMRYRAESVGGKLEIESSKDLGTKILLTIPTSAVR